MVAGRSRRMAGCMQYLDLAFAEPDAVSTMMESGFRQLCAPEFCFWFQQVYLCIAVFERLLQPVDMVMMAMREKDVGNLDAFSVGKLQHLFDLPGGIDYRCGVAGMIVDQVDEILHRAKFHTVDAIFFRALRHACLLCLLLTAYTESNF